MVPGRAVPGEAAAAVRVVATGQAHFVAVVDAGGADIGEQQGGGQHHALPVFPQQVQEAGRVMAVQQVELGQLVLERDMGPGLLEPAIELGGTDPDGMVGDVLTRQKGADRMGEAIVVHGAILLIPLQPLARLEEVLAEHIGLRVLLLEGVAHGAHVARVALGGAPLPQHVDDVEAPAVYLVGRAHPVTQYGVLGTVDGVLHLLAGKVQLGQAADPLPAHIVPLLIEGIELAKRRIRIAHGAPGRAEPGVLGRGVVDHGIQDDLHAALAQVAGQLGQPIVAAQMGVYPVVILGVVLVIARRSEDGVEVERRDPEGLQIMQLAVDAGQIAAIELAAGCAFSLLADRLAPGLADDGLAAVFIFVMAHAQGGVAIAEAIGKDLVEHLVLHPAWRLVTGVEAKMLLAGRHGGTDAGTVQPPLVLMGEALEAIELQILAQGQG